MDILSCQLVTNQTAVENFIMELSKLQQEIREKMVLYALSNLKEDYHLSDEDIGQIVGITKQAVYKIRLKTIKANRQ